MMADIVPRKEGNTLRPPGRGGGRKAPGEMIPDPGKECENAIPLAIMEKDMRIKLTAAIAILMVVLLGWQALHGGVPAHHLLANKDLPAISNWWGLLTLPALGWFALGRIERRYRRAPATVRPMVAGFAAGLAYGALLAGMFMMGRPDVSDNMAMGIFAIALLYPIYRAECILGFVIGMNFFLGAILPMIAACIFAASGAVLFLGSRFIWSRAARLARQETGLR
jgi:hypothetical protein